MEKEALENAADDISRNNIGAPLAAAPSETQNVVGAFSCLIQELRDLIASSRGPLVDQGISVSPGSLGPVASAPALNVSPHTSYELESPSHGQNQPCKRRRLDSCGNPSIDLTGQLVELSTESTKLPPPEFLEETINAYFGLIQPWIPILHETYFRRRLDDDDQRPDLVVLLHAMVVAASRFVNSSNGPAICKEVELWTSRSRRIVKMSAMEALSVENLQALIIVAFSDVSPFRFIHIKHPD